MPFGASAIGALLKEVLPSRNVILPVGLGMVFPALGALLGWTVAASPTLEPKVIVAGLAVRVVVAPVCPVAVVENPFSINSKAGKESRRRMDPHLHPPIKWHG
jgi:hypothetical protein